MTQRTGIIGVVDDDSVYRFTIKMTIDLLKLPYRVLSFADGDEVLNFIKDNLDSEEGLPDILFLDVNMPIMDGWDFLDEFEKLYPRLNKAIKVYMVSSSIDERDAYRSKQFSVVTDYLVKPVTEEFLEEILSNNN